MTQDDAAGDIKPYEGWKIGDPIETPASCLGSALGHLQVEATTNASTPIKAAAWCILQAAQKLSSGEEFDPHGVATADFAGSIAEQFLRAGFELPKEFTVDQKSGPETVDRDEGRDPTL